MSMKPPPLELLPDPHPLVGEDRLVSATGGEYDHRYPATGTPTRVLPLAGANEIDAAVRAARMAAKHWSGMRRNERRRLLLRVAEKIRENAEELATLTVIENGTPVMMAAHSPEVAADLFEYNAGWTDKIGGAVEPMWPVQALDYTLEEPFGVIGVIIPWNGPLASIGMVLAPALAAGNCVVLKPPELAPWTSLRMGELFLEAGLPPGVVNIVPGGAEAGEALTCHPGVDKLHFTGSGDTARRVLAGAQQNLTPVGLELGGKGAHLVLADADLQAASQQIIGGIVQMSGQTCLCGARVIAEAGVYDELVELISSMLPFISVGDPLEKDTMMGPVVSESAADRIIAMIERARQHSRLIAGGERLSGDHAAGYFIPPTVFVDVESDTEIAQQEVFGPVLSIMRCNGTAEGIRLANATRYGLAGYLWSRDLATTHRVVADLEVGNVWVNGFFGMPPAMPFGGVKSSGFGRLGGRDGIREFTRPKNVWLAM
jgi:acyl-CoA reductase-like NAD-dependent aldehyde dehydrogenase